MPFVCSRAAAPLIPLVGGPLIRALHHWRRQCCANRWTSPMIIARAPERPDCSGPITMAIIQVANNWRRLAHELNAINDGGDNLRPCVLSGTQLGRTRIALLAADSLSWRIPPSAQPTRPRWPLRLWRRACAALGQRVTPFGRQPDAIRLGRHPLLAASSGGQGAHVGLTLATGPLRVLRPPRLLALDVSESEPRD